MRQSVLDLRAFYATPLGGVTRDLIGRKVRQAWGAAAGLDVLALGYAGLFLERARDMPRRVVAAMPADQGVEAWPAGAPNLALLVEEALLPLPNALFDRVLVAHALEESESPAAMLREVWRVLAPSGRAILAVTARHGLWAAAETSPFGHGRPFSRRQLEVLVRDADLEPVSWTRALYAPPLPWAWRWAEGFERVGAALWPPFAGVILLEAVKQTYAVRPAGHRHAVRTRPIFQPAPASGEIAFPRIPRHLSVPGSRVDRTPGS